MKYLSILFLALLITSCDIIDPKDDNGPQTQQVNYRISGTAKSVSVTLENPDGGTSQFSERSVPWKYEFGTAQKGTWLYCSAQNNNETGSVTVEIIVDGNTWKSSTSEGAFVIATASGTL